MRQKRASVISEIAVSVRGSQEGMLPRSAVGMGIPMGVWVWSGYGDRNSVPTAALWDQVASISQTFPRIVTAEISLMASDFIFCSRQFYGDPNPFWSPNLSQIFGAEPPKEADAPWDKPSKNNQL